MLSWLSGKLVTTFVVVLLCAACLIGFATRNTRLRVFLRDLGYLTRPIWDTRGKEPSIVITHYHSDTVPFDKLCKLHGWRARSGREPKVIDAVIFSVELDILEIRMRELWDVVDLFLVVEADRTFTGKPKPLFLRDNLDKFDWAKKKLLRVSLENRLSEKPGSAFSNENHMRDMVTTKVDDLTGATAGDLIIIGDVDEIPFEVTIQLMKACEGYPNETHLQMQNYMYSFQFDTGSTNWKPRVSVYSPSTFFYHHQWRSDYVLADAGWHCSFCFRNLADFVFKMTSYSHSDRVTSDKLLDKAAIQRKICQGANIFDMYPEAYTFKELFATMGNVPNKSSTRGIPSYIVENPEKFKFLLPDGCVREDAPANWTTQ